MNRRERFADFVERVKDGFGLFSSIQFWYDTRYCPKHYKIIEGRAYDWYHQVECNAYWAYNKKGGLIPWAHLSTGGVMCCTPETAFDMKGHV